VTKKDFIDFMRKAVKIGSAEYKELHYFLIGVFQKADTQREGRVGPR